MNLSYNTILYIFQQDAFNVLAEELPNVMPTPQVVNYIEKNWVPKASMWANFGRRFYHEDHETNNLVER